MPNLDETVESQIKSDEHVSMPSLHGEDEENTQSSQEQAEVQQMEGTESIPMDLEDLQSSASDGQQLKFIVDENGQFLQLDNHILTTDADGNQILVQGTDQEQLQHLLQSVGVDGNQVLVQLQGNGEEIDGEGATLQMITGEGNQGQMILVQGADGESQLIDASMLQTEGGNLVLQQGPDGETHLTTADGIPVSVSFSGEGGEGHITMTMASGHEEEQQIFLQQPMEIGENQEEAGEMPTEAKEANEEDPLASHNLAVTMSSECGLENDTSTTEDAQRIDNIAVVETTEPEETPLSEESIIKSPKCKDDSTDNKVKVHFLIH